MSVRSVIARPVPAAALTAVVLLPLILAMVLVWTTGSPLPIDYQWFGPGGSDLLTGRWGDIYGDPAVQAGAFELVPYGVAHLLGVSGTAAWTALFTACTAVAAFLTALVLRPTLSADLRSSVLAAGGTAILALAGTTQTWLLGHPSEALIPLLWAIGGRLAVRDRPVLAAAVVAASSGFEIWGVLGAPVVLLAAHPRLVRSALTGAVVVAALWVPFVLAGPFEMFSFAWVISPDSLVHVLSPDATLFPWTLRLAQSVLAVAAGTAVALLLRGRGAWGPWLVVVAVVAGRLVFDPMTAAYYGIPALVGAAGALVLAAHRADLLAAAVAAVALVLTTNLGTPYVRAIVLLALCLLAALGERWRASRGRAPRRVAIRKGHLVLT